MLRGLLTGQNIRHIIIIYTHKRRKGKMRKSHIAIAGILVSVLGFANTAWADTATVIASQAYVDAKVGTKQNKLNAGTGGNVTVDNTSNTAASRAITGITATGDGTVTFTTQPISVDAPEATEYVTNGTNALNLSDSSDHAPSITAVKGMKSTSNLATVSNGVVSISAGSDTALPTTKAVADTIKTLDHKTATASSNATTAVTAVSQADGQVTVTNGTLAAAAIGQKVTSNLLSSTSTGYIPTVAAVQGAVTYVNNTASENKRTASVTVEEVPAARDVFTRNSTIKVKGDDFVPTVAAVEARVKAVEGQIPTNLGALATLDAVGSAQITDGSIAAGDLASNSVVTAKIKDLNVTTAKLAADAVTNAKLADDAVQTENIKDGTIVNADISNSAAIAYSKMDATLKDVNSASTNATCTAASPCVLTYYKVGSTVYYKWTNLIETDGVTALPNS